MFCKHEWLEIKETYAPPKGHLVERLRGVNVSDFFERLIYGVTTILWECKKCHKIRKEEMLGKGVKDDNRC